LDALLVAVVDPAHRSSPLSRLGADYRRTAARVASIRNTNGLFGVALGCEDRLADLVHLIFFAHHPLVLHFLGPLLFVLLERLEILGGDDQRVLGAFDGFLRFAHVLTLAVDARLLLGLFLLE